MSIATKKGDKGTTGLLFGGRVRKDSARIECNGAVDEAQSALGFARAMLAASSRRAGPKPAEAARKAALFRAAEIEHLLVSIERDLWVLMAEVATSETNRRKLSPGASMVTEAMVQSLTATVEELEAAGAMPKEFVVPGGNLPSAALDVARTVVRRAERLAVAARLPESSQVVPYLNRLSDVCWLLARVVEQEHLASRSVGPAVGHETESGARQSKRQ